MNLDIIECCPLFAGIERDALDSLLACISAEKKTYKKNENIFLTGEPVTRIGVVVSGSVHVVREDFWGNRSILAHAGAGELFGEAFSCAQTQILPVSVTAAEDSSILLVDYKRVITNCTSACSFHTAMIQNMIGILAGKNIMLTRKLEHVTRRTTREKLLSYLSEQAKQAKSRVFKIPFDRQELADYLSVDRSAMSAELGRMRNEGILRVSKNNFELL